MQADTLMHHLLKRDKSITIVAVWLFAWSSTPNLQLPWTLVSFPGHSGGCGSGRWETPQTLLPSRHSDWSWLLRTLGPDWEWDMENGNGKWYIEWEWDVMIMGMGHKAKGVGPTQTGMGWNSDMTHMTVSGSGISAILLFGLVFGCLSATLRNARERHDQIS